jgi:hypothetical protein
MSTILWSLAFVSTTLVANSGKDNRSQAFDAAEFLSQYRSAIDRLLVRNQSVHIKGLFTQSTTVEAKSEGDHETELEYTASNGLEKLRSVFKSANGSETVDVFGENTKFRVAKQSQRSSYFLNMDKLPKSHELALRRRKGAVFGAAYCAGGLPDFPDYVKSKFFKVNKVGLGTYEGRPCYNMDFTYDDGKKLSLQGLVTLDPSRDLAILSYDIRGKNKTREEQSSTYMYKGHINYDSSSNSPDPIHIVHDKNTYGRMDEHTEFRVSHWSHEVTPPSEFTLAAYGLGGLEKPATYKGGIVAIACFAIAAVALATGFAIRKKISRQKNDN